MKRIVAFTMLFLALVDCHAQQVSLERWTDRYIAGLTPVKHFRGNILVEREGHILLKKSYGLADESWGIPNETDGNFEIASLSKQFTAVAILQLAEAQKLSLQDRVSKFYLQAPKSWSTITVEELLNHTSGLPNNSLKDFSKGIAASYTPEELILTFRDRPLVAVPGTKWAYTNTEYYLLAYVIEKLSGEPYGTYLSEHIFAPLKMRQSGFSPTTAVISKMAVGYTRENSVLRHRDYFDRSLEIGAGGIHTTLDDLARWNHALDAPGFLTSKSLKEMFSVHLPGNYGYGWFIEDQPVHRIFHEGSDPGFAAFEVRYPDEHALIVVLANEDDAPVRELSLAIARHLGWEK